MVYQYLLAHGFATCRSYRRGLIFFDEGRPGKERKAMMRQWAKRDETNRRVMGATVGMYGDLQGIAGEIIQEIEGLELRALESGPRQNRSRSRVNRPGGTHLPPGSEDTMVSSSLLYGAKVALMKDRMSVKCRTL